ncbi:MAG: 5'/3'-nucleotidase SurE [Deltaproteobacteria bacterium]|nr:5'/3'-nucleotidase SurE [Deltaproteobacteria bacterium]
MKILLTNDDGIYASGLRILRSELLELGEISIVAPATEQSAVGHAITLYNPLRVEEVRLNGEFYGCAVNGTPADCVKIATSELLDGPPDLVVSGINRGANVGINVLYSGTVSAATEAAIMGIPGIAVSVGGYTNPRYDAAARFTLRLARVVIKEGLPGGTALNVNVPNLLEDEIRGVMFTRQSDARFVERFERREDPRKQLYYWQAIETASSERDAEDDDDIKALTEGFISVTPLHHDMTNRRALELIRSWKLY